MTVFEPNARGSEAVYIRGLIGFSSIRGDTLVTQVVGHDQDEIGFVGGGGESAEEEEMNEMERFHGRK